MSATTTRLRAMGAEVSIVLTADAATTADAAATAEDAATGVDMVINAMTSRIAELERCWSRFLPDSDISRLNRTAGQDAQPVHPATADIIGKACHAWKATGGAYDPTIGRALEAAGYDRSFDQALLDGGRSGDGPAGLATPAPGCADIAVHPVRDEVRLGPDVALDLGGIGKGYAADLLVAEALRLGAEGASVAVGGDVRAAGRPPSDDGWIVAVEDADGRQVAAITMADGAVATTSPRRRQWRRAGLTQHHLIDPRTGRPAFTGCALVTVVAGEAWWAEIAAKAAYLAGPTDALDVLTELSVAGLVITDEGQVLRSPGLDAFERPAVGHRGPAAAGHRVPGGGDR